MTDSPKVEKKKSPNVFWKETGKKIKIEEKRNRDILSYLDYDPIHYSNKGLFLNLIS
jgi:hypothetical protein